MLVPETYERILIERDAHGVVVATLNRPGKLNAVDARMHSELSRLAYDFDGDPDARVMVLTGAGRGFCAGGDFTDDPVGDDDVLRSEAVALATRFATGPLDAVMASKIPINQWLRAQSALILPYSIQLEERGALSAASLQARQRLASRHSNSG